MDYILEINGLEKTYKNKTKALKGIDIKLERGLVTGFIGMNGAGKTTTIKAILGLISKDKGEIKIFGKELSTAETEIKNKIGIVFDNGYLYEELKLSDMKKIVSASYKEWDNESYLKCINKFNLDENKKIKELSKGMKMKFAVVLALSHNAELLIMDEPTSGLDPKVRMEFLDIIRDFVKDGNKSVFFSTHITTDLDKIADKIIMINDGEITFAEEKDTLLETYALVKGDKRELTNENRKLFIELAERGFSFEGLTDKKNLLSGTLTKAVYERPTIEDIMLAYGKSKITNSWN